MLPLGRGDRRDFGGCMGVTLIDEHLSGPAPRWRRAGRDADPPASHPVRRPGRCTGCGTCRLLCPGGAIMPGADGVGVVRHEYCTGCGVCATVCPARPPAIEMKLGSPPADA